MRILTKNKGTVLKKRVLMTVAQNQQQVSLTSRKTTDYYGRPVTQVD
jgi:hypothetical protein